MVTRHLDDCYHLTTAFLTLIVPVILSVWSSNLPTQWATHRHWLAMQNESKPWWAEAVQLICHWFWSIALSVAELWAWASAWQNNPLKVSKCLFLGSDYLEGQWDAAGQLSICNPLTPWQQHVFQSGAPLNLPGSATPSALLPSWTWASALLRKQPGPWQSGSPRGTCHHSSAADSTSFSKVDSRCNADASFCIDWSPDMHSGPQVSVLNDPLSAMSGLCVWPSDLLTLSAMGSWAVSFGNGDLNTATNSYFP